MAFVDLSAVRDPRFLPAAIAQALHIEESPGRSARDLVLHQLRDRRFLLVLDNLEQLPRSAPLLAEVLASAQRSRCW